MHRWRRAGLTALLLASAGCTSDWFKRDEDRRRDDPLLGSYGRSANQPVAVATANQPQPTYTPAPPPATGSLPPLVPATPTSNAALASGEFKALPGGNDLRIGNTPPAPGGTQWQPGGFTDPRLGGSQAATGSPIRPVPADGPAVPGAGGSPVRPVSNSGSAALPPLVPAGSGLDQALRALDAYNPLSQKLTFNSQTGEWFFQVKTAARGSAGHDVKEAFAATAEQAVRAVLEQLARQPG
jgi:hypothetical protein